MELVELTKVQIGSLRVTQILVVKASPQVKQACHASLKLRHEDGLEYRVKFVPDVKCLKQYLTNTSALPIELNGKARVADLVRDFVAFYMVMNQIMRKDEGSRGASSEYEDSSDDDFSVDGSSEEEDSLGSLDEDIISEKPQVIPSPHNVNKPSCAAAHQVGRTSSSGSAVTIDSSVSSATIHCQSK